MAAAVPASVAAAANATASLGSLQNFGGYLGGALAPTITGIVVDRSGSFRPALFVGALVAFSAGLAFLLLVRGSVGPREASARR